MGLTEVSKFKEEKKNVRRGQTDKEGSRGVSWLGPGRKRRRMRWKKWRKTRRKNRRPAEFKA